MSSHHLIDLPGYGIGEELHRGETTIVVRGTRDGDGTPVVIKALITGTSQFSDALRLHHEHEILTNIQSPAVIRASGFERRKGIHALIIEDFGGRALSDHLTEVKIDVPSFLKIAVQIASGLEEIHARHVIHKDINPTNIVINEGTGQVKIIDFGIASLLSAENANSVNPSILEGTLPYVSPEQTGRMNRLVDYRTDFYSLGITFYEMLIGWLPFQSDDPMEILHSHIARSPREPRDLNPSIPRAISDIVMKLLAKTAEDRYQSAAGLRSDLEECHRAWQAHGKIPALTPGAHDVSDRFQIPQKLYGREEGVRELQESVDRACNGSAELLLVSGAPGIGKSALVNEVHKSIIRQRCFFVSGKFEQFKRDTPYAPFTQAFRELIAQIMSVGAGDLDVWRIRLKEALGPGGHVINSIIPEMEMFLGDQPPLQDLPPIEAQNRFNNVVLSFVRTAAREEHPLVLFLDDLQWADQASLKLIQVLVTDASMKHLLLVGAYRDDEVPPTHPLAVSVGEIQKSGGAIRSIFLSLLDRPAINRLLADTLHTTVEQCGDLGALVVAKTGGNPYFVNEFLKTLHAEGLLRFNPQDRAWRWDLDAIQKKGITDNVVTLMTGKIQRLPPQTQKSLQLAACVGNRFDLETLARVGGETQARAADGLWPAIQAGLILPVGSAYRLIRGADAAADGLNYELPTHYSDVSYVFAHDRVQQAAYSLIPTERAAAVHHEIGRSLLGSMPERVFDIVNHLNKGKAHIAGENERQELIRLNLAAGEKAKASAAFEAALHYFTAGVSLLNEEDWLSMYEASRNLLMERGECEYLTGNFDPAEKSFDDILARVRTPAEKGRIYGLKIELAIHRSHLDKALEYGIVALKILGVRLSPKPGKVDVLREMAKARLKVRTRKIADLINLPDMTDEEPRIAINLLMSLFGIAYSLGQELSALVVSKMMNLTLRFGNTDVSSYAYGIYGLLLSAGFGAYSSGYELALLGLKVSDKFNNRLLRGRCHFVVGCLHNHWHHHAKTNMEYLLECRRCSTESGDLLYTSYSMSQQSILAIVLGEQLDAAFESSTNYLAFMRGIRHEDIAHYFTLARQFVLNLKGETESPETLSSRGFDESEYIGSLDKTGWTAPRMYYRVLKTQLLYLHGSYDGALAVIEESLPLRHALIGQVVEAEFNFYHSLSLAAAYEGLAPVQQRRARAAIASNQKKMRRWGELCPANFSHKFKLVAAETARLDGETEKAMVLYDEAIVGAGENDYAQNASIASELAGRLYLKLGREKVARSYLEDARRGYAAWGASGKVKELEQLYPKLLEPESGPSAGAGGTRRPRTLTGTLTSSLDLLSVLKASQALSGEIVFSSLVEKMMTIVLENAGAQKGYLILEKGTKLVVEAEREAGNTGGTLLQSIPLEQCTGLSGAIVHYVARARETVVLHDAHNEGNFIADPYVISVRPKSILCMPILHQGKISGILYLENNLTTNAFTPARLEVLRLLSSQIAVSMDNARLYAQERELARMQEELRLAATIQRELLPKKAPEVPGYEIYGDNIPAQMVGGDYFDFIRIDDHRLAVTIGDVSGKGLPASLLMANLQAALRGQTLHDLTPSECIAKSNRLIYESTSDEKFATVFYGILDTTTHRLSFCNAGHEYPVVLSANGTRKELVAGGLALGLLESFPFEEDSVQLEPGDVLVIYSDGVTEAMNPTGVQFSRESLVELLERHREHPLRELMEEVVVAVKEHASGAAQSDDITLLALRRVRN